jgi:hypothetical protein
MCTRTHLGAGPLAAASRALSMRLPTSATASIGLSSERGASGAMSVDQSIPRSIACEALPSSSAPTVGSPSVRAATWSTSA